MKIKLWKYIEKHMLDTCLNPSGLAARAHIGRSVISRIQHGQCRPTAPTLRRIATALGLNAATLLKLRGCDPAPNKGQPVALYKTITVTCALCGRPGATKNPRHNNYPHAKCKKAMQNRAQKLRIDHENAVPRNQILLNNLKQIKTRTCLRCDKPFKSYGPGNRRCPECSIAIDNDLQHIGTYGTHSPDNAID